MMSRKHAAGFAFHFESQPTYESSIQQKCKLSYTRMKILIIHWLKKKKKSQRKNAKNIKNSQKRKTGFNHILLEMQLNI